MMTDNFEHTTIKTNGVNLHVVQAGPLDGPLVILLHGFPEFWYAWKDQIPALAEAGFRVMAPDQRGYNLSDKPRGVKAYRLDELAKDVIGLLDATGRDKCFLVGHDWGANVAWWTAINYPQRLNKLVILNVPHPEVLTQTLRKSLKQVRKSWYVFFFQIPWLPEKLTSMRDWQRGVGSLLTTSRKGTFSRADLEKYKQAWSQPYAMTAMINWYRAIVRHPLKLDPQHKISVPTLVIWGKGDKFLGSEMAQPSADKAENGHVEFLEASHWVQHEEPEQVNKLLIDFFQNNA